MKKYYLHDGTNQQGPFDLEELRARRISRETPVWYEGLADWTIAGNIPELSVLFAVATPQPFVASAPASTKGPEQQRSHTVTKPLNDLTPKKKKNYLGWGISITAGVLLAVWLTAVIISRMSHDGGNFDTDTYQQKVMTVEEMEQADPVSFLNAGGTYKENFWGDIIKIHGEVQNTATVANYKDVIIEVIFYSATNTELERKRYTVFDYFPAHSKKKFELRIDKPSNAVQKCGWEAVGATVDYK